MTATKFNLLIGTYSTGNGDDIAVYRFDTETGSLDRLSGINGIENPSYLCISANNRFVYAVNETTDDKPASVSAFLYEPDLGRLTLINQQPVTGAAPCYISVDHAQKHIFTANYASGTLSVLLLDQDGSLLPAIQTLTNEGAGPDSERQQSPHVHAAVLSPDEKYLLYTDLGTDKLHFFHYHPLSTPLVSPAEPSGLSVLPGHGPRHICFTPDRRFMYLVTEMGGFIYGYAYKGPQSQQLQMISLVADDFKGVSGGADLHVSPDGKYLYASNRGDADEIIVFSIDPETGWLTFVERRSSMGKGPRSIAIDPTGTYLLAANENTDDIYIFSIDKQTGRLTLTDSKINIGKPVCLKFTNIN